jgi:hexulose-6-phosphate isomerase
MTNAFNGNLKRREFLRTVAGGMLAAALSPLPGRTAPARALQKAIMWSTVRVKGSVLEKMRLVKAAGFAGVEMMGGMDVAEVQAALRETGLQAASVCCHTHWARPLSDPNPAVRETGLNGLLQSLRDARAYGATSVLLVPGVARNGVTYEQCWERSIAEIRKALPVAEETGVKIAIENVWNDFITRPEEAVRYLDELNSPWVGWHFDIGNVGRYSPAEQWIPHLGPRILKLHIKEFDTRKMTADKPGEGFNANLLEGTNHWPAILAALDRVGYTGWAIAEQRGGDSPEGLRDLAERMGRIFAS